MNVAFEASFARDLKRIRDRQLLQRLQQTIEAIKATPDVTAMPDLVKMQGYDTFYRVRLGDYRVGIEIVSNTVTFVRFLHRRDVYRYFP